MDSTLRVTSVPTSDMYGHRDRDISYLLINPPLTDPTAPYHSISYLIGAATAAGYENFSCLDANVIALNYLAQEDEVADLLETCRAIRSRLEHKRCLTRWDQLLYRYALRGVGMEPDSVIQAIHVLKDPKLFYHYPSYRSAVQVVKRWLGALSVRGFPGQFCDNLSFTHGGIINFTSMRDLTDEKYIGRLMSPFLSYFNGPFTRMIEGHAWDVIGLSVNYMSQLHCAIFMTRLIRSINPNCIICLGGTEISDDVKYLRDPNDIWSLFPDADALVIGEGETAFIEILNSVACRENLPQHRPGILLQYEHQGTPRKPVRYENVASLPPPRYDIWDWEQYWAPEPVILYSPTRGCYWNKCTFCDYGLNTDTPTSPSRERPVELAIRDLQEITRISRTLYLAVDAISPRYLRAWAAAITSADINIRWSAELRLERSFLKGRLAEQMRQAGCVAISFGYESASQRILDLIDKGVKINEVPAMLRELARVGIGVQMMGFIGFPGETPEEARETFDFLMRHQEYWTLAGIGEFALTQGSIVAKHYRDFEITKISARPRDDIIRVLLWTDKDGRKHGADDIYTPEIESIANMLNHFVDDRPFVGGIDSTHSILYFAKYGPSLVRSDCWDEQTKPAIETTHYYTPLEGVEKFLDVDALNEYLQAYEEWDTDTCEVECESGIRAPTIRWLCEHSTDATQNGQSVGEILEIYPAGTFISLISCNKSEEAAALIGDEAYQMLKNILLGPQEV